MNLFEFKRLKRLQDKDDVFRFLDARSEKSGFFNTLFDIYIFALSVGVKNKKRSILHGATSESVHISYFTDEQKKFMDMIIVYDSNGNIEKLDKSDEENVQEMLKTLEEYANGGLEIILKTIENHPENSYEQILLLLKDELTDNIPIEATEDIAW